MGFVLRSYRYLVAVRGDNLRGMENSVNFLAVGDGF